MVRPYERKKKPRPKKYPPCATCKPRLERDNHLAFQVYGRCGDEWLTAGMEGVRIAIPGPAIEAAMNASQIFDPDDRTVIYDQVKIISRAIVAQWSAKAKREQDAKSQ